MTKEQIENKAREILQCYPMCEMIGDKCRMGDCANFQYLTQMAEQLLDNLWISVEDELPEIKEHYVSEDVICRYSDDAIGISQLKENIFGQEWFEYENEKSKVTHWMPIPKLNEK